MGVYPSEDKPTIITWFLLPEQIVILVVLKSLNAVICKAVLKGVEDELQLLLFKQIWAS